MNIPTSSCVLATLWTILAAVPGMAQPAPRQTERGPISLPEVTQRASLVVRGTVAASKVEWVGRTIYTLHDLVVTETIKGSARTSVTIAVPGGAIGNVKTVWPGAPAIRTGDEMVFLGVPFQNTARFTAVGLFDGLVTVHIDSANGNAVVFPRGGPESLNDFLAEVRSLSRP